ncbi:MAG: fimbrial protein [Stenotrophomonas sp.]|uniref:fimbrial protein n=1 Tax=Stenotrophomonas sp. TaxID=69392 RepID=UPI003D6D050A
MNKIAISTALLAIAGFSANSASAADGRITLSGSIDSVTCSVRGGSGTDGADGDFTVAMKRVSQSELATAGSMAGYTDFSVVIGGPGQAGCTNGKVAKLAFNATGSLDPSSKRLRNTGTAGIFVNVGITDENYNLIDFTTNANSPSATISGNTATLKFKSHYYANMMAADAGSVEATVMYGISYN